MPLFFCILHQGTGVLGIQGVYDVEEVLPVHLPPGRERVGEVAHEIGFSCHHGAEILNTQLVVEWDVDELYLREWHERFPFSQNFLEEVLVDHDLRRNVELNCTRSGLEGLLTYVALGSSG